MQRIERENHAMRFTLCTVMSVLALAGLITLAGECNAQAKCPWLNAATAAGLLGGEVQLSVTAPVDPGTAKGAGADMYSEQARMDRFDVSCDFTRKTASSAFALGIVVKTMADYKKDFSTYLALCGGTTVPLKGIGNEAVQCVSKDLSVAGEEKVIARVRDRAFVLTVRRETKPHAGAEAIELTDGTRNIAEQVAGSLF
jgi:hypothetical protein